MGQGWDNQEIYKLGLCVAQLIKNDTPLIHRVDLRPEEKEWW